MFICVIDDNVSFAKNISIYIESLVEARNIRAQTVYASNSAELDQLDIGAIDILFCDIDLGEECENGIQLAKRINNHNPKCQIIFVSSYVDFAPDVYCAEHVWFVLKERLMEQLPYALDKALNNLKSLNSSFLIIKQGHERTSLCKSDIVCIESHQRRIAVYCIDRIEETYGTLIDFEKLLANDGFVRCHNSYIVNIKMVVKYSPTMLMLIKDMSVPISRQYKEHVKKVFMEHSLNRLTGD